MMGPGDGGMLMETCRNIIAIYHANSREMEPMGSQIYETFNHSEVTRVSSMTPNTFNNYELEIRMI